MTDSTEKAPATHAAAARRSASLLVPGGPADWATPTGGYRYDRQMVAALTEAGWSLDLRHLAGTWPRPDTAALAAAATQVVALADGTLVVADGLAYGVLDEVVAPHAERLRWVALVHHPLHLETGLDDAQRRQLHERERRALQLARQVIVTSVHTARDVAAMGVAPARIAVVEPGTDRPSAHLGAQRSGPRRPGPVRLLCVATLTPRKGHALLLRALSGLAGPAGPASVDWELHCVGSPTRDPATAAAVMAQAREPALARRVHWHGEVDDAALQAHYAAADLLVLPSLHEGYGMVVAEALGAGLPVLASHAGALAQTLPAGAGWQVPPGDVPALQAALARLIADPALRAQLAAGAAEAGQRLPGWREQAARFAVVLENLS